MGRCNLKTSPFSIFFPLMCFASFNYISLDLTSFSFLSVSLGTRSYWDNDESSALSIVGATSLRVVITSLALVLLIQVMFLLFLGVCLDFDLLLIDVAIAADTLSFHCGEEMVTLQCLLKVQTPFLHYNISFIFW